jgi:hypothetical protein
MRRIIVAAIIIIIASTSVGRIRRRRSTVVRSQKDRRARLLLRNFLETGPKNGSGFHSSRPSTNQMRRTRKYRWIFGCPGRVMRPGTVTGTVVGQTGNDQQRVMLGGIRLEIGPAKYVEAGCATPRVWAGGERGTIWLKS